MIKNFLLLVIVACLSTNMFAEGNPDNGKSLFKTNCASCHNKNMVKDLTGPALKGVAERWEGREDVLAAWIRNSSAVLASGDKYANDLYNEWNQVEMTAFTNLKDQDIEDLLSFIEVASVASATNVVEGPGDKVATQSNNWMWWIVIGVLALLALFIARLMRSMDFMKEEQDGVVGAEPKTTMSMFKSSAFYGIMAFLFVVFAGYNTFNGAVQLGRQQGYEPTQPIKFSHATHAGVNQIECKYCHDGARRSKHSIIPATNTCMNCHKAITTGSKYGTAEITKIFASIGYNPNTAKYIENYDDLSQEEVAKVYKEWIETNAEGGNGEIIANRQWEGVVESLTNDHKDKVQGPIQWTRIHALPDHVYFNHAQHTSVGQLECQTCHGEVQDMEIVKQHAPLSMGWCVNCHRQTNVNFKENDYYKSYTKFQEEIEKGERKNVTVEEIGGTECQKCHY